MLKNGGIILAFFILFGIHMTHANTLIERTISGYKAKIIEYKTDSKIYDIKIGIHPKDGGTLRSIMGTVGGISGVNGVFECPKDYSECGGKNYTINERYVEGEKKAKYKSTGDRVVFGWDKEINPFLFQTDTINKDKEEDIWEGFANHPLLLKDGVSQTERYHEKGLIDSKMKSKATKNFICSNKAGDKIFFGLVYNIDIDTVAIVLKDFGCWNAINLDAGASTTFIYNGKYILNPQREILDGVFIVPKNIDTKKLDRSAKNIMTVLLTKMKGKTHTQKIKQLQKLNTLLNTFSQKIYAKNTTDVYTEIKIFKNTSLDENSTDNSDESFEIKKTKVGTKTEITKISTIKQIYLINILRTYTAELISIHQKINNLRYIKKLDMNVKFNVDL